MMPPPPKPSDQANSDNGAVQSCVKDGTQLIVELKSDDGYVIPETPFRLEIQGGDTHSGRLDLEGRYLLKGLPPGKPFALYYTDKADVRAKTWAARLDAALSASDVDAVCGALSHDPWEVGNIAAALETYFGRDLEADCRSTFSNGIEKSAVAHCLHLAGYKGGTLDDVISPQQARAIR